MRIANIAQIDYLISSVSFNANDKIVEAFVTERMEEKDSVEAAINIVEGKRGDSDYFFTVAVGNTNQLLMAVKIGDTVPVSGASSDKPLLSAKPLFPSLLLELFGREVMSKVVGESLLLASTHPEATGRVKRAFINYLGDDDDEEPTAGTEFGNPFGEEGFPSGI